MKFTRAIDITDFLKTVKQCKGEVWLESYSGERIVMKNAFSRYVAMAALLTSRGDELELFCQLPEDRQKFYQYFYEHPDVIGGKKE